MIEPTATEVLAGGPSRIVTAPVPALTAPSAMLPEVVLVTPIAPLPVAVKVAPPVMPVMAERAMPLVASLPSIVVPPNVRLPVAAVIATAPPLMTWVPAELSESTLKVMLPVSTGVPPLGVPT